MINFGITVLLGIALGVGAFSALSSSTPSVGFPLSIGETAGEGEAYIAPISPPDYLPIRNFDVTEPVIVARAALLVDGKSGRVLFSKNTDQRLPIASITKLMTAMIVIDHLDLSAIYTATAEDMNVDGNGADFHVGEKIIGKDLLKIMLVQSSNDAAMIFAHARPGFLDLMNSRAQNLNMENTHFNDPAGLDDHATYSTASDVVKLVSAANKYPLIADTLRLARADVRSADGMQLHHVISTNKLLSSLAGIIIGKTGNTDGARGTMALEVKANEKNDTLIAVILGSEDRFAEMKKLIDWGIYAHKWSE